MSDVTMRSIALKAEQGVRLSEADALWLFQHADLTELGQLANRINLRNNGRAVFYNVNRHINPTNICSLSCKFCAYSKKLGEEGGYAYDIDEMIKKAGEAIAQGATELHMVGGLHPRWNFQRYVDMIAALHQAYPEVHLKAFTAVELDWMARKAKKTVREVMIELHDAGLGSFPGGGAEIFHADVRDQICDTKVSGDQWIDIHRTAHQLGLRSNCTMLYGHIEKYEHRVDHMRRLRELQDETNGFNVFIPLAFQPFDNEMGITGYTAGADDLKTIAVARLYLDNFKHIKAYWVMLGQDIAQLALHYGANDLDGTVIEEKISRAAGGRAGMIMTRTNLESLIRRSDRIPVERTTLYDPVHAADLQQLIPVDDAITDETLCELLRTLEQGDTMAPSMLWKAAVDLSLESITGALRSSGKVRLTAHTWAVSESEIAEVPQLRLKATGTGVDWSSWADEVIELRLRATSNHVLFAIKLIVDDGQLVMPSEYLKALALTRLFLPVSIDVLTPLSGLSVLSPVKGLGVPADHHPVTKLVSLLHFYGSSGVGPESKEEFDTLLDLNMPPKTISTNEKDSSAHG